MSEESDQSEVLRDADGCPHPRAQALLAWWRGLPLGGRWPDWRAVDKPSLKPWMGWIVLYDVLDGGTDFSYRLVGTHVAERAGLDLTGKRVSQEGYSSSNDVFLRRLTALQHGGQPKWIDRPIHTRRGYSVVHDRLCLPFANGGPDLALWLFYICGDKLLVDRYHRD